jgi:hypothetical protein
MPSHMYLGVHVLSYICMLLLCKQQYSCISRCCRAGDLPRQLINAC